MSEKKVLSENDINRLNSIKNALKDNNFVESLVKLEKPEDVQAAFKEKGIELSLDEIHQLFIVGRAFEYYDILMDTLGSILMLLFIKVIKDMKK